MGVISRGVECASVGLVTRDGARAGAGCCEVVTGFTPSKWGSPYWYRFCGPRASVRPGSVGVKAPIASFHGFEVPPQQLTANWLT